MPTPPKQIKMSKLLLVEGQDAYWFSIWAVQAYGRHDIQVMDFGGVSDLKAFLALISRQERYESVDAIVIARDAEADAEGAQRSISDRLREIGLPVPSRAFEFAYAGQKPKIAFMLFPAYVLQEDSSVELLPGALEHLCLYTVQDDPLIPCIEAYVRCAEQVQGTPVKRIHKAKLHAFLACKGEFAGMKLGEAANARAWNWDHTAFEPYKKIIQSM